MWLSQKYRWAITNIFLQPCLTSWGLGSSTSFFCPSFSFALPYLTHCLLLPPWLLLGLSHICLMRPVIESQWCRERVYTERETVGGNRTRTFDRVIVHLLLLSPLKQLLSGMSGCVKLNHAEILILIICHASVHAVGLCKAVEEVAGRDVLAQTPIIICLASCFGCVAYN